MSTNEAFEDNAINKSSEERFNSTDNTYDTTKDLGYRVRSENTRSERTKREQEENRNSLSYLQVFRYTNGIDKLLIAFGSIAAIVGGCCQPVNIIVYGNMASVFIYNDIYKNKLTNGSNSNGMTETSPNDTRDLSEYSDIFVFAKQNAIYSLCICIASLVSCFCATYAWSLASARTVKTIRRLMFRSLMRQDISWHDKHRTGEIAVHLNQDMYTLADGTGIKAANFVQLITTFSTSYIFALYTGWKLTLIVMPLMILNALTGAAVFRILRTLVKKESKAYTLAGIVAEEIIRSIRTVIAFGGQQKEYNKYRKHLLSSKSGLIKKGLVVGIGWACTWITSIASIVLSFWQGLQQFRYGDSAYDPGNSLIVFFVLFHGAKAFGSAFPTYESLVRVNDAAQRIFKIIDHAPAIDTSQTEGETPNEVKGNIYFNNVHFHYPCRPGYQVLNGLSIDIKECETVAIVGPSGCGKSCFIQLVQRFYDPQSGMILLDNKNLMDLNVNWLRNSIGVVSQEPVVFATTIEENIRYGRLDATQAEIKQAARNANAHSFIEMLPEKYQTVLGEDESKLSGGQKQRIAIARALLRNPKILLLDEATSALDYESETAIQSYLEKDKRKRTTIIVAHRLSTIRNADMIYVMCDGTVISKGTHDELLLKNDYYKCLINKQTVENENEKAATAMEREFSLLEHGETRPNSYNGMYPTRNPDCEKKSTHFIRQTPEENSIVINMNTTKSKEISATPASSEIKNAKAKDDQVDVTLMKILRVNSKKWYLMVMAVICSVVVGCTLPVFAVLIAYFLKIFTFSPDQQNARLVEVVGYFGALTVGVLPFRILVTTVNARFGASLTLQFRLRAFKSLIWQDVPYFDDPLNTVGAITSRFSTDAAKIQTATGSIVALVMESCSAVVCMFVIGFMFSWKLTLAICPFLPALILSGFAQNLTLTSKRDTKRLEEIGQANIVNTIFTAEIKSWVAEKPVLTLSIRILFSNTFLLFLIGLCSSYVHKVFFIDCFLLFNIQQLCIEAVEKIRTVASLTRESFFISKVNTYIDRHYRTMVTSNITVAFLYGISQSVRYGMYAVTFWYGGYLIQNEKLPFENILKVFGAFFYGGNAIGIFNQYIPDYKQAKLAAGRLLSLMNLKPKIDANNDKGNTLAIILKALDLLTFGPQTLYTCNSGNRVLHTKKVSYSGELKIDQVDFNYAYRPDVKVLDKLSVQINAGETVALVGESGCGKSTIIYLIERFYDPVHGSLTLDGHSYQSLNLCWLRQQLGIVSQEPVLFDSSIAENIAYGDNSRVVPMDEIIRAARMANIHTFIESLPEGYETNVGSKGTQLSGGQKQRVAIARALLRNPKVLLLDEATSALDYESEQLVQKALDAASRGRTCITIAHRLSTIQNAHKIIFLHGGQVQEIGTHSELMDRKGMYYRLNQYNEKTNISSH